MASIVITGSTKGIGLGLAQEFLQQGHQVAIAGRSVGSVQEALKTLNSKQEQTEEKLAERLLGVSCDVSDHQQVQNLWDKAQAQFGVIDIWINNAGLARTSWSITDVPQSEIETMVSTNILGTINGCRVAAKGMQQQARPGKIFNMLGGGSDGEYFPGMGIYGTTKCGLNYFTDALSKELQGSGILVGKIRPGMVITEAVIREAKADLAYFEKSRVFINNLVDQVETVAPFLVARMLKADKSGQKIAWLNGGKIALRLLKAKFKARDDQFSRFGL